MQQKIKVDICPQHGYFLPCQKCGLTSRDILTSTEYIDALDIMDFKIKHYTDDELTKIWRAASTTKSGVSTGYKLPVNNRMVVLNWEAWLTGLHSALKQRNMVVK